MRKKFSDLSVNIKTLILLFAFVLLPLMVIGWMVFQGIAYQKEKAEDSFIMDRVHYAASKVAEQLDNVKNVADILSVDDAINDVVLKDTYSFKHYESNRVIASTLEHNDYIVKTQLILHGRVIWQYSSHRQGYVLDERGNEKYSEILETHQKSAFWSPVHPLFRLKAGAFEEKVQVVSFYSGIYGTQNMKQQGVLALHIAEESICDIYWNSLYGNPSKAWIVGEDGQVFSATEKMWLEQGVPKELQLFPNGKREGRNEVKYEGEKVQLSWEQCGNWDLYLVQMNKKGSVISIYGPILMIVLLILLVMGCGYMYFYKLYITRPLEVLMIQMEKAKSLELRQKKLPARGDEIGTLTTTFQDMLSHIDELIRKVYIEKIKTQEAEKEMMLSQINPHFLYNTLDSIRWTSLSHGDKEVAKQLEALSLMLRNILNFGKPDTTISQEIQIVESYCYLLQARFRKDIEVTMQIDPLVVDYHIPKLLIQPLVENAYVHGLESKQGLKKIWIKVHTVHNKLIIYVADNGIGCNQEVIRFKMKEDSKECFALKNIRDRIDLTYGEAGKLKFASWYERGTIVKIVLPLNEEKRGE